MWAVGEVDGGVGVSARRFAALLLAIAALALAGRVVYVLTVARYDDHVYDEFIYLSISELVTDGEGFVTPLVGGPEGSHPPLTSLSLVPASAVTDLTSGYVAQRVSMAVLGALSVVVIGLLGRAVAGPRAGLIAAAVAAVYPNIWLANTVVMSESLVILITALALLVTYRFLRAPTWLGAVAIGVLCGLAALTRAELLLLAPMLLLPAVVLVQGPSTRTRAVFAVLGIAACGITIAPWVVRNLVTYEEPTFLSTGDGTALLATNCDEAYYGNNLGLSELECALVVPDGPEQSVRSARRRELAIEYLGDHFTRLPLVTSVRVLRMWELYRPLQGADLNTVEGRSETASLVGLGMYYVLVALTAGGIVVLRRRRITMWPLIVPLVLATFIAVTTQGANRYRAPAEVSLVVLGAVGLDVLITVISPNATRKIRSRNGGRSR